MPRCFQWPDDDRKRVGDEMDAVVHRLNAEPWAGFSGAQVGAAKNIAACILRRPSYREALRDPALADRLIQVCKKDLRKESTHA